MAYDLHTRVNGGLGCLRLQKIIERLYDLEGLQDLTVYCDFRILNSLGDSANAGS